MATTAPAAPQTSVQLRNIPLSAIVALEGWNPRMSFDDAELQDLSASMLERGCLVPVIVQATGDGDYRLVDGEKRYKAAVLARHDGTARDRAARRRRRRQRPSWRPSCSSTRSSPTGCAPP